MSSSSSLHRSSGSSSIDLSPWRGSPTPFPSDPLDFCFFSAGAARGLTAGEEIRYSTPPIVAVPRGVVEKLSKNYSDVVELFLIKPIVEKFRREKNPTIHPVHAIHFHVRIVRMMLHQFS